MEIIKNLKNGTYNITLSGNFSFNDHPEFREILQQMENADIQQVILHMSEVEFVDSAALGMLLLALDTAKKHEMRLVISGAKGQVKKMFNIARFDTLFTLQDAAG